MHCGGSCIHRRGGSTTSTCTSLGGVSFGAPNCYARADGQGRGQPDLPVADLTRLLRAAKEAGFRQVELTGGEPLLHRERDAMLDALTQARGWAAPMGLVLRSNLALLLDTQVLQRIALAVDRLVVSVDGDQTQHDARRGSGSYAAVVRNLDAYQDDAARMPGAAELCLAATIGATDRASEAEVAVRDLARRLGVSYIRIRRVLPLGRASEWKSAPIRARLTGDEDPMDRIEGGFRPLASCGLGENLHVEVSGDAFPCYAYTHRRHHLGNVVTDGLRAVIEGAGFAALSGCAVDSVQSRSECRTCDLRYICGGGCRAWLHGRAQSLNQVAQIECREAKARAEKILQAACGYLNVTFDDPVVR